MDECHAGNQNRMIIERASSAACLVESGDLLDVLKHQWHLHRTQSEYHTPIRPKHCQRRKGNGRQPPNLLGREQFLDGCAHGLHDAQIRHVRTLALPANSSRKIELASGVSEIPQGTSSIPQRIDELVARQVRHEADHPILQQNTQARTSRQESRTQSEASETDARSRCTRGLGCFGGTANATECDCARTGCTHR